MAQLRLLLLACVGLGVAFAEPAEKPARLDVHGDPLPERAVARLGTERLRHGSSVTAVAYSPDGKFLAAASHDAGQVTVWEMPSGKRLQRFIGLDHPALRFSPDGSRLAAIGQEVFDIREADRQSQLRVWEVASGKVLLSQRGKFIGLPNGLDFLADGKRVAALHDGGQVQVWEIGTDRLVDTLRAEGFLRSFALRPDGKHVGLTCDDGAVVLWDLATGKKRHTIPVGKQRGGPAAISPAGDLFAYEAGKGVIVLADAATGKERHRLEGHREAVNSVAFAAAGKVLLSSSWDPTLRVWDVEKGTERLRIEPGHSLPVAALSPDGTTVATGGANSPHAVQLWDAATGKKRMDAYPGHVRPLTAVAVSPDGKLAATCAGSEIGLWETATGKPVRTVSGSGGAIRVAFSPDGTRLVSAGGGGVRLWDVATGRELAVLDGDRGGIATLLFSQDGRRLATLHFWYEQGSQLQHRARVLDVATGETLHDIPDQVVALHLVPDGRTLLVVRPGGRLEFWDGLDGRPRRGFTPRLPCTPGAVSPDGQLAATVNGRDPVQVRELATGELVATLPPAFVGYAYAFGPAGRVVAVGTKDGVRLYDLAADKELPPLTGHWGHVSQVVFSADGTRLFSASEWETSALVWDVADLHAPLRLPGKLDPAALERLGHDLAGEDAATAHKAIWRLVRSPDQALPLLRTAAKPEPRRDATAITRLVRDLDAEDFDVRETATEQLERLGAQAEEALRAALRGNPSQEQRQRVERLLARSANPGNAQRLGLRVVAALERIGSAEAVAVLKDVAAGDPDGEVTGCAKAALARLQFRNAAP